MNEPESESIAIPWYAQLAIQMKEAAFTMDTPLPAIPPVAIAERKGVAMITAVANHVDKDKGLRAADFLWRLTDCDAVIFIAEAYGKPMKEGEKSEPGQLQATVEAGRQDAESIFEVINCFRAWPPGMVRRTSLPFHSDGPGSRLVWLKSRFDDSDGGKIEEISGYIPRVLREITAQPKLDLRKQAVKVPSRLRRSVRRFSREAIANASEKAVIQILRTQGYTIL